VPSCGGLIRRPLAGNMVACTKARPSMPKTPN
jgi:hypothetical protein